MILLSCSSCCRKDCIISNVRTHRSSEITTPLKPKRIHRPKRNPHTVRAKFATVPVIIEDTNSGSYSVNSIGMGTEQMTYYIPVTEEGQIYNEKYVESTNSGVATDSRPDPHKYFTITTYIRYTMYPAGSTPDVYVSIDNVAITRTQEPSSMEWDVLGVGTPKVKVSQRGVSENGGIGSFLSQVTDYMTVQWGLTGVNTPSSWVPVLCDSYSDQCFTNAVFKFDITYSTMGKVSCEFVHSLSK